MLVLLATAVVALIVQAVSTEGDIVGSFARFVSIAQDSVGIVDTVFISKGGERGGKE